MSFFPNMFTDGKGFRSYLLHIDNHGAVVAYHLDGEGKPINMVSGTIDDVIGSAIKNLGYRIVHPGPSVGRKPPFFPWDYGLSGSRWAEVVRILNGKGKSAGRHEYQVNRFDRMEVDFPYLKQQDKPPWKWELTDSGIAMDAMIEAS